MSDTRTHPEDERLEAWIDGRLGEDEARRFEARLGQDAELARRAALARRIEGGLARRFAVPGAADDWIARIVESRGTATTHDAPQAPRAGGRAVSPAGPAERHGLTADENGSQRAHHGSPSRLRGGRRLWPSALLAATVAAALLLALRGRLLTPSPESTATTGSGASGADEELASATAGPRDGAFTGELDSSEVDAGVPVGPLVDATEARDRGPTATPDLETLYSEAVAWASDRSQRVCGIGDRLAGALLSNYGEDVQLRPGAEGRLQGPFGSSEWPTGMILTGSTDAVPAVLVAERHDQLTCCLNLELPPDSDLQVFTWRVGEMFLTEITPSAEPLLLDYISRAY